MKNQIHRQEIVIGVKFKAPVKVGFAWQEKRGAFSVWYRSDDETKRTYQIFGTGHTGEIIEIVSSCVMPDGFTVIHLCEVLP